MSYTCIGSMIFSGFAVAGQRCWGFSSSAGRKSPAPPVALALIALAALAAGAESATAQHRAGEIGGDAIAGQGAARAKEPIPLIEERVIRLEESVPSDVRGRINGVAFAADRLFVLRGSVFSFSPQGEYLGKIGRRGLGRGEYDSPRFMGADAKGNVYVVDRSDIEIFTATGEPVDTWPLVPRTWRWAVRGLSVSPTGTVYVVEGMNGWPWTRLHTVTAYRDGAPVERRVVPTTDYDDEAAYTVLESREPESLEQGSALGFVLFERVPFVPHEVFEVARTGAIVTGTGNAYMVERHLRNGDTQVIERAWEPIAVKPEEAEWHRHNVREAIPRVSHPRGWSPDDPIPAYKPAFLRLFVDHNDRTWVIRAGAGTRCSKSMSPSESEAAPECWEDTYFADVFAADGAFLGAVDLPPELRHPTYSFDSRFDPPPYIKDNTFIAALIDESGRSVVKIYRFELPQDD